MLGDHVRVYRVKNLVKTAQKTKRILEEAGLHAQEVPGRVLLPILDTCSLENDDDLQERWAGLLATASQEADSFSPSFIETLKQLTPKEAQHLDRIFATLSRDRPLTHHDPIPYGALAGKGTPSGSLETLERLGLVSPEYKVKFEKPTLRLLSGSPESGWDETEPSTVIDVEDAFDRLDAEVGYQYHFTAYALRILHACRGPHKERSPHKTDAPVKQPRP